MTPTYRVLQDPTHRVFLNLGGIPKDIIDRVLEPEARLHAQDLIKFTFPKKAADGKKKIEASVRRMFLTNKSPSLSQFTNPDLQARIDACRGKGGAQAITAILKNAWKVSGKGVEMPHVEASRAGMERHRSTKNGGHARGPRSFSSESAVKSTIRDIGGDVGGAKKGWIVDGVKAPSWVVAANGPKGKHTHVQKGDLTSISVENNTAAMEQIENRTGVAAFVVSLRGRKIKSKLDYEVRRRLREGSQ